MVVHRLPFVKLAKHGYAIVVKANVNDSDEDIEQTIQQYQDIKKLLTMWASTPIESCSQAMKIGLMSADDIQFPEKVFYAMAALIKEYDFSLVIFKKINDVEYGIDDFKKRGTF